MSHEELYQEAKQETILYLQHASGLYQQWQLASKDRARQEQIREKIVEAVDDATDRVNELAESNDIVEKHRQKFAFTDEELENRRKFVAETQRTLNMITRAVQQGGAASSSSARPGDSRGAPGGSVAASKEALMATGGRRDATFARLETELVNENERFIQSQEQRQRAVEDSRNQVVDELSHNIAEIGEMGRQMGTEIDEHLVILNDLTSDADNVQGRLERHIKRVGELIDKSSNTSVLIVIVILVLILVGLVALLFI